MGRQAGFEACLRAIQSVESSLIGHTPDLCYLHNAYAGPGDKQLINAVIIRSVCGRYRECL